MLSDLYRISKHDKASFHNGRSITAAAISLQVIFLFAWVNYRQIRFELLSIDYQGKQPFNYMMPEFLIKQLTDYFLSPTS